MRDDSQPAEGETMNAMVERSPEQNLPVPQAAPMSPMQMVALAVQQGMPIETLRELRQMQAATA